MTGWNVKVIWTKYHFRSPCRYHLTIHPVLPNNSEMRSDLLQSHSRLARPPGLSPCQHTATWRTAHSAWVRSKLTANCQHVTTYCKRRVTLVLPWCWSRAHLDYESDMSISWDQCSHQAPAASQALLTCANDADQFILHRLKAMILCPADLCIADIWFVVAFHSEFCISLLQLIEKSVM